MSNASSTASLVRSYVAIALVSCAVLLFEIAITRILSVVSWYHFAFLAISMAMLGLGAPGVWFALKKPGDRWVHWSLIASGIVVPLSIMALVKGKVVSPGSILLPQHQIFLDFETYLLVLSVFLPLLCLGSAVCLLLMQVRGNEIGRMYAADLFGATMGALIIVPLMHTVPTPVICAGAGLFPLLAAWVLRGSAAIVPPVLIMILTGGLIWGEPFKLRFSKTYYEGNSPVYEKWTPTARITIFPDSFFGGSIDTTFVWGRGSKYIPKPTDQLWLEQDGSAGTPITRWTGSAENLTYLEYDVTSLGYQIRPINRACVIGSGGGRDILTAIKSGVKQVDGVELNPHIVAALSGPFREYSGDVYHMPGVTPYISEGRSFLTQSPGNYGMIQISLIDSWAATAAGAFSLSENYLYTTEAIQLYWQRLAPNGIISISRWFGGKRRLESMRLIMIAVQALRLEGISDPSQHLCVVHAGSVATLIISRSAFDAAQIKQIDEVCQTRGFIRHWPNHPQSPPDSPVVEALTQGIEKYSAVGLDISPATDDRPFFFQSVSLFKPVSDNILSSLSKNEQSVVLLRTLLWIITILTFGLFLIPFLYLRRGDKSTGLKWGSSYFWLIGVAFMLTEIPWMQRFILFLGHPSYSTTVVLATLLLGAGLGSLTASRLPIALIRKWGWLLPVVVLLVNFLLAPVFQVALGWAFVWRLIISLILLFPAGLMMGFAFPTGMGVFAAKNVPWFWAMNGIASVLASVFSLAISMTIGFTATAVCGVIAYGLAYLVLFSHQVELHDSQVANVSS